MLHDHIQIIKWSLTGLSWLHCIPLKWDKSSQRIAHIKTRTKLNIVRAVQILQLGYFGLVTLIAYNQYKSGCLITLLPNVFMWLVTITLYLWGMGIDLSNKAGALLNTTLRFEIWMQDSFKAMDILPDTNSGKSITNRWAKRGDVY